MGEKRLYFVQGLTIINTLGKVFPFVTIFAGAFDEVPHLKIKLEFEKSHFRWSSIGRSKRLILIHGLGGLGKTTLATDRPLSTETGSSTKGIDRTGTDVDVEHAINNWDAVSEKS